jgi:hypothetical protein
MTEQGYSMLNVFTYLITDSNVVCVTVLFIPATNLYDKNLVMVNICS